MRRWWLTLALLLSVGVNVGILATLAVQRLAPPEEPAPESVDPWRDQPGGVPPVLRRLVHHMGLEGAERERFLDLQRTFLRETVRRRRDLQRLQGRLRREVLAPEPDRAAVDELLERLAEAHAGLERLFVESLLDTREILDPRQERLYLRFLHHLRQAGGRELGPRPGAGRRDRPAPTPRDRPPEGPRPPDR